MTFLVFDLAKTGLTIADFDVFHHRSGALASLFDGFRLLRHLIKQESFAILDGEKL
jgi:hypothetical protein